jgi:hypothetical protein
MSRTGQFPGHYCRFTREIVALTTPICLKHLNQEYADLSRKATHHLCQNKAARLTRGKPKSWAAAIVYALAQLNFLSDCSIEPCMAMGDLCRLFGVSQQTASNKAREIRELLNMTPFQNSWTTQAVLDMAARPWMEMVDTFLMETGTLPPE